METALPLIRDVVIIISGLVLLIVSIILVRNIVPLLGSARQLTEQSTRTLRTLEGHSREVSETLISARALTDALNETHQRTVQPALQNVQEVTERLNRTARDLSGAIEESSRFTKTTVRQVTYFRDRVFRPLIELASLWHGLRAVTRALPIGSIKRLRGKRKKG